MNKITFIGAGSTIFAKNILGDCMFVPALENFEFALFDIDETRLKESEQMLKNLRDNYNPSITINAYTNRREALSDAAYVINAIQVGGYKPSTVIDFEIPKSFGLEQTIGDTIGIGGLFRTLRTLPVMFDIARDIEKVCPDAWLLNYTNPMSTLTAAIQQHTNVKTIGLCHSVQVCVPELFEKLDIDVNPADTEQEIAGINHMAWLLKIKKDGKDLYPEIKQKAREKQNEQHDDMVRFELMEQFGYYVTESSEHNAEYHPYFIKSRYPDLIDAYNIPLDEYPRRCVNQIEEWEQMRDDIVQDSSITHERSNEYGSRIIEAIETDVPFKFGGNLVNRGGLISNLPENACVEVPCVADRSGIAPTHVGALPEQLAALNRTNINTQIMTVEAVVRNSKDAVYQAALLDPHTSSELSIADTVKLCDALIEAHGDWLPPLN
ncbi:alpha-glucosidase/alpha-galactosidase [Salisediminibacterium halotolerans]|uniref:Alpha-galactosidase n=1 Tax=Salisediminibacterium halotolerans TaxID=517425 RepID=A0A1H9QMJ5_9BACI|nr:alpha-glucosidase/alpha-galactosidase [Salisediminibacterium haloalkalitolerans]SER61637.1 alpha-galactosidase [Salisediminibacterium haloalkalitolerans]